MKHTLSLLQGRLGVYNKNPYTPSEDNGVQDMSTRLRQQGGHLQQERMIIDKKRTLDRAVWNSYQAAEVRLLDDKEQKPLRALINPNKLKLDYDDKIISIDYNSGIKIGSVFEWIGTKTYWIVYLQDITELAYFKGDVRKCTYEISYKDKDGNVQKTYAAIRGPVETKINSMSTHGLSMDTPNYSLYLVLPKTAENVEYFQRYSKFYLQNLDDKQNPICWQVEAVDSITSSGIIEIHATENFVNKDEDDVEQGIVGGLIEEKEIEDDSEIIVGETFIKTKKQYIYTATGEGEWFIDSKYPVTYSIDGNKILLKWNVSYSGQFDLYFGKYKKTIVVESLF